MMNNKQSGNGVWSEFKL